MKVGILSDTHGNVPVAGLAVRVFKKQKVSAVFHCGDIGSFDVLTELAAVGCPVHVVFGNVDAYSSDWKYFPTNVGVRLHGRYGEFELAGKRIALLHGDDHHRFASTVSSGNFDYAFSGHTHAIHDYVEGNTRCINPGTAGRGTPNTCATLDFKSGKFRVFTL